MFTTILEVFLKHFGIFYTPYSALPVDERIFVPQKALDPFDENFDWKALEESPEMDNKEDMIEESKERDEFRLENREKKK